MKYNSRPGFPHDYEPNLATMKKRFFAFFIDWIAILLIYCLIILLFGLCNMHISAINVKSLFEVEIEMSNSHLFLIAFLKFLFGFLPLLYFALSFYFFKGQTIGKYFLRLRVLSLYHKNLGFWHCIERALGYFASAFEFGFGYFQAFWNPNRMALHDKIGETIVIEIPGKKLKE